VDLLQTLNLSLLRRLTAGRKLLKGNDHVMGKKTTCRLNEADVAIHPSIQAAV